MRFTSPSKGKMTWQEMMQDIINYISDSPNLKHKIIIGSDSHVKDETCFVTAIIVHRVGKGAKYYYRKHFQRKIKSLRQKIFYEASMSLETASRMTYLLGENGHSDFGVEIHLDVGTNGKTKELIREVVGMVTGSGFDAKIKPDSCGASKVADKHTK